MKRFKMVLVLITVIVFFSCDDDRDDIDLSVAEANAMNLMVQEGEWSISKFSQNGSDKTALYEDYIFIFENENKFSAISSLEEVNGTWRISNDAGSEFDAYDDVDFNIYFSSNGKLSELTRNYDVISATNNLIQLNLDMNQNGDTVELSFSKN